MWPVLMFIAGRKESVMQHTSLLTNERMKGENNFSPSSCDWQFSASWGTHILWTRGAALQSCLKVLSSAAGEVVETVLFLLFGCQGQLSGLVLGRRGKATHARKRGIFVVVSGAVATGF